MGLTFRRRWYGPCLPQDPRKVPTVLSLSFPQHKVKPRHSKGLPTLTAGWSARGTAFSRRLFESRHTCWEPGLRRGPSLHQLTSPSEVGTFPSSYRGGKWDQKGQGKSHVGNATPTFLDTFLRGKPDSTPSCITLLGMCSMVPWNGSPVLLGGAGQTPSLGVLIDLPKVTQPQVKKADSLGWLTAKKGFFPPNHNSFGMKKSFSALSKQQRHQRCF